MPEDSRIDEVKTTLDSIKADDIAEDVAYESQIADLQTQLATAVAEKNAALDSLIPVMAERDTLLAERTATIADLVATRDALQSQITSLDARISALGG